MTQRLELGNGGRLMQEEATGLPVVTVVGLKGSYVGEAGINAAIARAPGSFVKQLHLPFNPILFQGVNDDKEYCFSLEKDSPVIMPFYTFAMFSEDVRVTQLPQSQDAYYNSENPPIVVYVFDDFVEDLKKTKLGVAVSEDFKNLHAQTLTVKKIGERKGLVWVGVCKKEQERFRQWFDAFREKFDELASAEDTISHELDITFWNIIACAVDDTTRREAYLRKSYIQMSIYGEEYVKQTYNRLIKPAIKFQNDETWESFKADLNRYTAERKKS